MENTNNIAIQEKKETAATPIADAALTAAAVGLGGLIMGFRGLKCAFSQGHKVANGIRLVADGVDYVSTKGEEKCEAAIVHCEDLQASYDTAIQQSAAAQQQLHKMAADLHQMVVANAQPA